MSNPTHPAGLRLAPSLTALGAVLALAGLDSLGRGLGWSFDQVSYKYSFAFMSWWTLKTHAAALWPLTTATSVRPVKLLPQGPTFQPDRVSEDGHFATGTYSDPVTAGGHPAADQLVHRAALHGACRRGDGFASG